MKVVIQELGDLSVGQPARGKILKCGNGRVGRIRGGLIHNRFAVGIRLGKVDGL